MEIANSSSYEELSALYQQILQHLVVITQDFAIVLKDAQDEELLKKYSYIDDIFDSFRERAKSELLSIAFFGAFSSGKSFLISGLQHKIDWFPYEGGDQYAPLLPASSRHTSSCPVAVEPLPSHEKKDRFWVVFEDSKTPEERIPAVEAIIQAYVTDLPNAKAKRLYPKDRTRTVVKATVGISNAELAARFYDLPGFGAIGVNYEDTIRSFVQQADCIVYIAWAIRPLDVKDLDLLRDVYNHHKDTGKRVFFVLSQIDRNRDFDSSSDKVGWEDVLEANNEFLTQHFLTKEERPDFNFIGDGFIPVSPAYEAKAIHRTLQSPSEAKKLEQKSQMQSLRNLFIEYLQNTSGPMHLAELSSEMQLFLTRMTFDIRHREMAEATPLEKLRTFINAEKAKRRVLIDGKKKLKTEFEHLGQTALSRAFAGSDADNLAFLLRERLEDKILKNDVLKESVINEIELEKASIVREWISRDKKALIPRWVGAWDSFVAQSNERLENLFLDSEIAFSIEMQKDEDIESDEADIAAVDITERLKKSYQDHKPQTVRETIEVLSTTWKTWSFVAGVGGSAILSSIASAAAIPAMATLGPIGWGIMATAIVGAGFGKWKLSEQRKERRQQMLDSFPNYSRKIISAYTLQAQEFVESRIGKLFEVVDDEVERLDASINSSEQRLIAGDSVNRERRLETLRQLSIKCIETDDLIKVFYRKASELQPSVAKLFLDEYEHAE